MFVSVLTTADGTLDELKVVEAAARATWLAGVTLRIVAGSTVPLWRLRKLRRRLLAAAAH